MKTVPLLTAATALLAVVSFTSCGPSRVYANKDKHREREIEQVPAPPPPRSPARTYSNSSSSSSLIISPRPGFVMQRSSDGRFYHRNHAGMLYWKGYDNRFYLDRGYLHRVRYSQWEYDQWKRYARSNGGRR